jgi:hypothetical protein
MIICAPKEQGIAFATYSAYLMKTHNIIQASITIRVTTFYNIALVVSGLYW